MTTLWFVIISLLAYLPYKGRAFVSVSWQYATLLFIWFVLWSLVLIYFVAEFLIIRVDFLTVGIVAISMGLWFVSPFVVRRYGRAPISYIKKNPIRFLVRFEFPTMLLKLGEIIFQQAGFLYMLFLLLRETPHSLFLFTIMIAVLHLWNVFVMPVRLALFYFVLSLPMAIIFWLLIQNGFVLVTTSIHILFYLLFNGSYWVLTNKKPLV